MCADKINNYNNSVFFYVVFLPFRAHSLLQKEQKYSDINNNDNNGHLSPPSQESPGCLQNKLNTQMYARTKTHMHTHTHDYIIKMPRDSFNDPQKRLK